MTRYRVVEEDYLQSLIVILEEANREVYEMNSDDMENHLNRALGLLEDIMLSAPKIEK